MEITHWIESTRAGDPHAFTQLVVHTQNLALGYAFSYLGDFHRAQDVVQETFMIVHEKLHTLESPEAFPGWLRRIVHHRCMRVFRQKKPAPVEDLVEDLQTAKTEEALQRKQEHAYLLEAIKRLPEKHRLAVTLYYLKDQSQDEVASFLGWPKTKVNNTLHEARNLLKRRLFAMAADTFREQRLDEEFAKNIGEVVRVRGRLVDIQTLEESTQVFDLIGSRAGDKERMPKLIAIQRLEDGRLRCVSTGKGVQAEDHIFRAGGVEDAQPLLDETLFHQIAHQIRTQKDDAIVETGIKALDFFAPLSQGDRIGIFGKEGVGRAVFLMELLHLQSKHRGDFQVFFYSTRWNAHGTQDMLEHEPALSRDVHPHMQTYWLLHPRAADPMYVEDVDYLDCKLYFNPLKAAEGLWPAVDPLYTTSRAVQDGRISSRHATLLQQAHELLMQGRSLTQDPVYLEWFALDAREQAKARQLAFIQEQYQTLEREERQTFARTRRLERYMTQPFFVAESFSQMPGISVSLEETLCGVEAILNGEFDETEEEALMWRGA